MSKSKDSNLSKRISEYLKDQNRPFSANEILSNIQIECGKTAFTRALDLLVSEQKIVEKTYGKQKIFFINQDIFNGSKNEDLQNMDSQINELSNTLNTLQKRIKTLETDLSNLDKSLKTETAEAELKTLEAEVEQMEGKLKAMESKSSPVDPEEKKILQGKKDFFFKEYQRRKRLANNVIDAILEGYPKSKKQLLDEIGIEADEGMPLQN